MYFFIATHFFIALISLIVGCVVFLKNYKSTTHITLALFSFSISFWAFFYGVWLLSTNTSQALFWARMLNLGATFIPIFLLHWLLSFLGYDKKRKKIVFLYYVLTIIFALFSFSHYYISSVAKINHFLYWPQAGWLYVLFLLFVWSPIFFYSVFLLVRAYKKGNYLLRQQIIYILIGFVTGFLGGSTNYFLMFGCTFISPIGSILVVMFPILFSYAVIKHHLMDIRLVLRKSSVVVLSLLTIILPVTLLMYVLDQHFVKISIWSDFFIIVISVLVYPPIKGYYFRLANKYFFSSLYDSREVIRKISNGLRTTLETKKIYDFIYHSLLESFHLELFGVLRYDEKEQQYIVQYNQGFKIDKKIKFSGNKFLHNKFVEKEKPIVIEEIKNTSDYNKKTRDLIDTLDKLGVAVLSPLNIEKTTVGLLVLGLKESGDMYNDEDLQVLETISAQIGVAVNNARLYAEVKNFNIKLKKKVESATAELHTSNNRLQTMADHLALANDKLRKLDNAKSEFISIASHQLRTPLTAIKGFVSLLLEGSYGKISKEVRTTLNKIYLSNERLIELVEDLLNISRIESGRIEYKFEEINLANVCQEIMDTFVIRAKEKHLKIELKLPKKPLPTILTDKKKIREVISNLVDNAIKYTPKGWVKVSLLQIKDKIQIRVSDTGLGISAEEIPHLFAKFSRGKDISKVNTGGTGLGLYVGRKMIESLQGKIWIESKGVNLGSTFIIEIPIRVEEEKEETVG